MLKPVVAICLADLHLSHKAPVARSCEEDWYAVQARYLKQLLRLSLKYEYAPIIVAGDIFDKWNPPSELVNFALAKLPSCWAVPGNHDLSSGGLADIRKTAFWTLVQSGKVGMLEPGKPVEPNTGLRLHGFPFSHKVKPLETPHDLHLEIAVIHDYIYADNLGLQTAQLKTITTAAAPGIGGDPDQALTNVVKKLKGFDSAVFGDNHLAFFRNRAAKDKIQCSLWNCGTFMRRKSDEQVLTPCVGLMHNDGTFTRHYLDVSKDQFLDPKQLAAMSFDMEDFIGELSGLQDVAISFEDRVRKVLGNGVAQTIVEIILKAMERTK